MFHYLNLNVFDHELVSDCRHRCIVMVFNSDVLRNGHIKNIEAFKVKLIANMRLGGMESNV